MESVVSQRMVPYNHVFCAITSKSQVDRETVDPARSPDGLAGPIQIATSTNRSTAEAPEIAVVAGAGFALVWTACQRTRERQTRSIASQNPEFGVLDEC